MTTLCAIVAILIVIAALGTVAADARAAARWHKANAQQLARQLDASNSRLEQILDEHASCPAPYHSRGTFPDRLPRRGEISS
jgi:hypothetical protein